MNEKKTKKPAVKPANRCKKCGFKIGGKNHEDGFHHANGSAGRTGMPKRY